MPQPTLTAKQADALTAPLLMHTPTMNKTHIVFVYAGDLWSVPRSGGQATRLTASPGNDLNPRFSPDGTQIAFTGQYDGNLDVYVMPAAGGVPKRLTAHPGDDKVLNWTPDGKSILFNSSMASPTSYGRMFSVGVNGGFPKQLPFPAVEQGCMSPDGSQVAYIANQKWQQAWKRYRGGQTTSIWIANLSDSKWKAIPRKNTNDKNPMWVGDSIYYLSDPKGPVSLMRYDLKSGRSSEEVAGDQFEIKSASAGPGGIVYERFGSIWVYDAATRKASPVKISIQGDFPEVRTQFKDLRRRLTALSPSPSGQRLVGAARGFIFTTPAAKGDARILTPKQGVERKDPAWSPDGKTIAYISDERGKDELVLLDVATNAEKFYAVGEPLSELSAVSWSPDSKKITFQDNARRLWVFDAPTGTTEKVDQMLRRSRVGLTSNWSPDSKWIAYTKDTAAGLGTVRLYSLATKKSESITDGLADLANPVFDRGGKYLYFTGSTDVGLGGDMQDIASYAGGNVTSNVYCAVLKKGTPSPLGPESDEEKVAVETTSKPPTQLTDKPTDKPADKPAEKPTGKEAPATVVDFDGLEARILTLPFPRQPYAQLEAGTADSVLAISTPLASSSINSPEGPPTLHRFSFSDRKLTTLSVGVGSVQTTPDGTKLLVNGPAGYAVVPSVAPFGPGQGAVPITDLRMKMDPRTEWRAMFYAAIRKQKINFYDPKVHGVDLDAVAKRYEPFLENLVSRADLNEIFTEIFGEICVGHMFIGGGDIPRNAPSVAGGLLGADFSFENGKYRLSRVYTGERWNPGLYAPLAQPGVEAKAGEYLLAVDGRELNDSMDLYEALEAKTGRQVKIKIGPTPDGVGAREAVVVPIADESQLRFRAWSEDNRKRVEAATGGRVGYVHVPDTNVGGWREFMRYYYAQTGKDAIIIDERFNGGGAIADFLVREMIKPIVSGSRTRHGEDFVIPAVGVFGPKVMLANEMAGSGGDIFPHLFRFHKVGPIIGRRTWGAMISNYNFGLVDGGRISSPDDAMYNPDGTWMIENVGTAPDIEVELDPYLWRQGKDAQLEAGIKEILRLLEKNPPKPLKRPDYPSIPPFKPASGG